MTQCRCSEKPFLWSVEADAYAGAHLVREEATDDHGVTVLRCPETGRRWLQDHPADEQGRLTLRLRWEELTPADVVEYLANSSDLETSMLTMDPEVEHQPLPGEPVLHGLDELREYMARYLEEVDPPRSGVITVVERAPHALVLGHVSHNRDGRYVEHRPAAWIVTVRDARVVRVVAYSDWARARKAAGFDEETSPKRRIGSSIMRFLSAGTPLLQAVEVA
jgi:ketosteroid isomerase-like protein